jgi:mannose-1-phosphate guanylyltransferase
VRAVVLVGGFGTRLRPLTATVPKQMLPVVDRPMIECVLVGLAAHGVDDAVLSLGYRPDAFIEAYPDDVCAGVQLHYAVESEPLDTAGAVLFAAREGGIDGTFVVVNGDVLTDLDLTALWDLHRRRRAEATIALTPVDDPSRFGVVPTDEAGRVEAFIEKPAPEDAPSTWINAGTYVLEPSVLDRIPSGRRVSIERETFPAMVEDRSLYAVKSDVYWVDAGTPATYLQAQLDLVDGVRGGEARRALSATADIDPEAEVEHSVVMDEVSIGAAARVSGSAILPGAVIEPGAVVDRSVVGPCSLIGAGARLEGLTVTGAGVRVEPGSSWHDARIPEEG